MALANFDSTTPSGGSSSNPFDALPIETVQHIGSFLTYDSDLCRFRLICRSTLDAVDADNCSFWVYPRRIRSLMKRMLTWT
jgi:hypothetical protein